MTAKVARGHAAGKRERKRPLREEGAFVGYAQRVVSYAMYWPPLADRVEPVMKPASSATRNRIARAISSAWPSRPTGIRSTIFSRMFGGTAATMTGLKIARDRAAAEVRGRGTGALGGRDPNGDLIVSPRHKVLVRGDRNALHGYVAAAVLAVFVGILGGAATFVHDSRAGWHVEGGDATSIFAP